MKRRLKVNGVIICLTVLCTAIFSKIFLRREGTAYLSEFAEICGIAFILLGQLFRASARGYKAEYSQDGRVLIQGGPYSLVRNPMYLGILFIGLGVVFLLFKWWVAIIFLLIFGIRYLPLIFKEEKKLLASFPQAYEHYCAKVPRILPSSTSIMTGEISEYLPLKSVWLKKEAGTVLAVLLITLIFESWEDVKNEGLALYFKEAIVIIFTIILFSGLVIYLIRKTNSGKQDVSSQNKTN